ncbi:hypothetical protein MLD38_018743 [Melastoma candidum]|uniref:Uncharacterized protein n=1 Tax=Melastoma candidum TaxID=119954 RepID=A0ACB9QVB2_9MYRT|nr:hypothetical protein MLD38_018743 [Melastoma candidum]
MLVRCLIGRRSHLRSSIPEELVKVRAVAVEEGRRCEELTRLISPKAEVGRQLDLGGRFCCRYRESHHRLLTSRPLWLLWSHGSAEIVGMESEKKRFASFSLVRGCSLLFLPDQDKIKKGIGIARWSP